MYTQCPLCDTQYRISAVDLKAALGKVRCAHCHSVFNTLSQLTDMPPEIPTLTESVGAPEADIATVIKDESPALHTPETITHAGPHIEPYTADEHIPQITAMPAFALTQAAADALQDEEAADERETSAHAGLHIEPYTADEIPQITDVMPVFAPTQDTADLRTADAVFEKPLAVPASAPPSRHIIPELVGAPARLMADEFAYPRKKPYGGLGTALWSSGIILLLALLAMQYVYAMRNDLARTAEFRPLLEPFCAAVKIFTRCEIPLRRDLTQIELQGRSIRPHPRFQNALLVSVTLLNKASFRQAYPAIELTLADFNGALIARRRFQPADYLLTDVDIKQGLAPQGVTQVGLEIATPAAPLNLDLTSWDFVLF